MYGNIESERKSHGYSKAEFCKKLGITVRTYWNYLNGKPIPSDKLLEMARLFGCSTDYLLGRTRQRDGA